MEPASALATATAVVYIAPPPSAIASFVAYSRDAAVAVAALVGAFVAWKGLRTWRSQLTGKAEYDLAKRLLRLFYRYRDAVAGVRSQSISLTEMFAEDDGLTADEQLARASSMEAGLRRAHEGRRSRVQAVRAELYPELLESEVLWGPEVNGLAAPLFALEEALSNAILDDMAVEFSDLGDIRFDHLRTQDAADRRRDLMYEGEPGDDAFADAFQTGLDAIAKYLSRYLRS